MDIRGAGFLSVNLTACTLALSGLFSLGLLIHNKRMLQVIGKMIAESLEKPARMLVIGTFFVIVGLVLDGTLWRLYQTQQNFKNLQLRLSREELAIVTLQAQLKQIKNPSFIEKQARERLEFLEKNDLLFVFSEE